MSFPGLRLIGRSAVLAVLVAAGAGMANAQEAVVVTQRVRLEGTMSRAEAERAAFEGAMAEAVRRVAGVRVSGTESMVNADSAGTITSRYAQSVRLDAAGHVTSWTLERGRWTTVRRGRGVTDLVYDASYRMVVARDAGARDEGFRVTLTADRARYEVRGTVPSENDEVVLTVGGTRDAHLVLVAIGGDSVRRLVPNAVQDEARLAAGQTMQWPSAEWRERGLHFRVSLPNGVAGRTEVLAVVALQDAEPWPRGDGATVPLGEFNQWLVGIPASRRAVAQVGVRVERR